MNNPVQIQSSTAMKTALCLLVFLLLSSWVVGQTEQQVLPSELKQQTVVTESVTLHKGFFRTSFLGSYTFIDKIFDDKGDKGYVLGTNGWARVWSYQLTLEYGITDRLEISLMPEFVNKKFFFSDEYHFGTTNETAYANQSAVGFGDIVLGVDYQILTETSTRPSLVAKGSFTFPTGRKNPTDIKDYRDFKLPTGSGEFVVALDFNLRKIFYPYSITLYAGYAYHFEGEKILFPDYPEDEEIRFKSGDRFDVGGSFNFHLNDWIALQNQVYFFHWGPNKVFADQTETGYKSWVVSYQPVLNFQIRRFRLFEIISIPIMGKNNGADPFYVLGLLYTF